MTPACKFAVLLLAVYPSLASESDALAISANIRSVHMPFGTILDPIYSSSTSTVISGYTRCGDSALWTGAYLAAESFRYKVAPSADALANVKAALAGLKSLVDVTGDNRLARCIVRADSPYAAGIESEEANNTVHQSPPFVWLDNTSRDQVVGAFFGLDAAFDLVDDAAVKAAAADLAARLIGFVSAHQWSPNDSISNTFLTRPEELQTLLQVARHVNPSSSVGGPVLVLPVETGVLVDVQSTSSYFKFNLDFMSFFDLIPLQNNAANQAAYRIVRSYTASHRNAFFDIVDRALEGPDNARDAETRDLLDQWLARARRDPFVDLTKTVPVCGAEACQPVPVPLRVPTDFLWQRDPFQLTGGGSGLVECAGIDYILPYWMSRYYGVISANVVQSAAAPTGSVAPGSIASLYGANLAAAPAQAGSQPPPAALGGVTLAATDSAGVSRNAPLLYVSPTQINFIVPEATALGAAQFVVANGSGTQNVTATVQQVAPALFSLNGAGTGVAAATAILTQAANPRIQTPVPVFQCNAASCSSVPIDLGVDTPVYVTFYGTGIRNRASLADVSVVIHGSLAPVLYAGPAPGFTGLDQINVALPLDLRGSGESNVVVIGSGQTSNTVTINIR